MKHYFLKNFFSYLTICILIYTSINFSHCGTEAGNPSGFVGIDTISLNHSSSIYFTNDSQNSSVNQNTNFLNIHYGSIYSFTENFKNYSRVPLVKLNTQTGEISPAIVFDSTETHTLPYIVRTQRLNDQLLVLFDAPVRSDNNDICHLLILENNAPAVCLDNIQLTAASNLNSETYPYIERTRSLLSSADNQNIYRYITQFLNISDTSYSLIESDGANSRQVITGSSSHALNYYSFDNESFFASSCRNSTQGQAGPRLQNWCQLNLDTGIFDILSNNSLDEKVYLLNNNLVLVQKSDFSHMDHLNIYNATQSFSSQTAINNLTSGVSNQSALNASAHFSGGVFELTNRIFAFAKAGNINTPPLMELSNLENFNHFDGFSQPLQTLRIATEANSQKIALSNSVSSLNNHEVFIINSINDLSNASSLDLSDISLLRIETLHFVDEHKLIIGGPKVVSSGNTQGSIVYSYYLHKLNESTNQNQLFLSNEQAAYFDLLH